ncbi:biotin--[acetyl-CoA-carboxylase] ligase [Rhizobium sp. C1]|uniref:biotin--[acetyl-CoA-carboxylase] ligase n=1 Tax=Rhizobium sp. C1 TaxID=1349799 RepID=UPI001E55496B|nr:biotin--[acetyl-CoA-carboxylase] ligase [Rhizobium sp. C1]MCD2177127.1 biotin--[acetyl-CoA-carboxylase] ligase [Rhizobium sp. C1]
MDGIGIGRKPENGFRQIELNETPSTNLECLERARSGDPGQLWVTARRQTSGRARRGRSWVSEPGNLYASLLLIDPAPFDRLASLPLVVSLAVYDAIRRELPADVDVRIKWPNDVLVEGCKVSGILLEGETLPGGHHALVIGCGVNIAHKPAEALYPVTCLAERGATCSPEILFARLYEAMERLLKIWDRGEGTSTLVSQWRAVAKGIGEPVTVNLPDRSLQGIFSGIDAQGMLLLDLPDGTRQAIAAGDVFFMGQERN